MSRFFSILIILAIVIFSALVIYYAKDSYKLLSPGKISEMPAPESNVPKANYEKWVEYTAPMNKFKVLLPSLPQHANDTANDPVSNETRAYDTYVAASENGTTYMINLITFPQDKNLGNAEKVLKQIVQDMVSNKEENQLKNMEMGQFKNKQALTFQIENKDVHVHGLAFIQGRLLGVLTMVTKKDSYNPDDFAFFTNSFELENGSGKQ